MKKKKKKVKDPVVQDTQPQFTKEQLHKRAIAQRNYNKVYSQMNGGLC